jgi:hypothetical protein
VGCQNCERNAILVETRIEDPVGMTSSSAYESTIASRLAQLMTIPCLHLQANSDYSRTLRKDGSLPNIGSEVRIPEYSFESDFISGLNDRTDDGRTIRSKWTITMYFDGYERELVHQWQSQDIQENRQDTIIEYIDFNTGEKKTYNPANEPDEEVSFSGLWRRLTRTYHDGPDISEIIKQFEKKPSSCTITPGKDDVPSGESIEIKITDFKDENDQKSREFNRIVVHAQNGKIRNGEVSDKGPDYKAFLVRDGSVTLLYDAPDNCEKGEDKITVYSACEILPVTKVPFSATKLNKKIGEKVIIISCFDAILTMTKTQTRTIRVSFSEEKPVGTCTLSTKENHDLNEIIEATVKVNLKVEGTMDMPMFPNQKWVHYKPVSVDISGFVLTYNESKYDYSNISGGDCFPPRGHESTVTTRRTSFNPHIFEPPTGPLPTRWIVVFDSRANKALKMIPGGYRVDYGYNETLAKVSKEWPVDNPDEPPKTRVKEDNKIDIEPVGDLVADPFGDMNLNGLTGYMKEKTGNNALADLIADIPDIKERRESSGSAKIHSDLLVTTGNGITDFGGEGHKKTPKQMKGGSQVVDLKFVWNMKRIKK